MKYNSWCVPNLIEIMGFENSYNQLISIYLETAIDSKFEREREWFDFTITFFKMKYQMYNRLVYPYG